MVPPAPNAMSENFPPLQIGESFCLLPGLMKGGLEKRWHGSLQDYFRPTRQRLLALPSAPLPRSRVTSRSSPPWTRKRQQKFLLGMRQSSIAFRLYS